MGCLNYLVQINMKGPKPGVAVENFNNFNFNRNLIKANVVVIEICICICVIVLIWLINLMVQFFGCNFLFTYKFISFSPLIFYYQLIC